MTAVREVMQPHLVTLEATATVLEAARRMRDSAIGDVLVTDGGKLRGIVTDRDLVVRCLAQQKSASQTPLGELCSRDLITVTADESLDNAARLMNDHAVRRLPVVEADKVVGIVALGDLAVARDRDTALGGISAAPPNA